MTLRLKKNHAITFTAPNIRYVKAGIMSWYKIEHPECDYPKALSPLFWEEVKVQEEK